MTPDEFLRICAEHDARMREDPRMAAYLDARREYEQGRLRFREVVVDGVGNRYEQCELPGMGEGT